MSLDKRLARDLSPVAVKRAVLVNATQRPLTVYGAAAACLGGAFALLFSPSIVALGVLGGGAVVGLSSWVWEFGINGNKYANDFVRCYRQELESRRQEALDSLLKDLRLIGDMQGIQQINAFRDKYDTFVDILDRKLTPGELTYNRYLSIAEQVFLGGLDNLENVAVALKSISAIDVERLQVEIKKLSSSTDDNSQEKLRTLKARLDLRTQQVDYVQNLVLENEKALTQLDHVSTKIATINTQQGRSQIDLEDAMKELQRLIQRADNYSD